MKIIYISQFDDNCGYGSAARGYLESIDSILSEDKTFAIYSVSLESNMSHLSLEEKSILSKYRLKNLEDIKKFISNEDYCLIWHMPPPMLEIIFENSKNSSFESENKWHNCSFLFKNSKQNINISAWEADKIPDNWIEIFQKRKTSGVIVPSKWNYDVYKKSINNVFCVPHLIRTPSRESKTLNLPFDKKDKFVFFSMSQWDIRKGFDALIRAYLMEFKNQDDVILLLKTYGVIVDSFAHLQEQQRNNIMQEIVSFKKSIFLKDNTNPTAKIVPIIGPIEYEKINYLYDISDSFVLATRGEGFGLTIAEAFLKNKKIIVPKEGGHLDYLKEDKSIKYFDGYWTPYTSKPGYDCDMNWYEPDLLSLRKNMRESYNDWKNKINTSMQQRINLSKQEIGDLMMNNIKHILNRGDK